MSAVRSAAFVVVALSVAMPGLAQETPATIPTRDVDVTYTMTQPAPAPGAPGKKLEQRMRWGVAAGKLRVDPPVPGLYMIMDRKAHRLATIRDADRTVFEMERVGGGMTIPGVAASGANFTKRGENRVAGLNCTQWETRDAAGQATLVCLTADGVLLRAAQGDHVLLEAAKVAYAPVDPATFDFPAGYKHIGPPPDDVLVPSSK